MHALPLDSVYVFIQLSSYLLVWAGSRACSLQMNDPLYTEHVLGLPHLSFLRSPVNIDSYTVLFLIGLLIAFIAQCVPRPSSRPLFEGLMPVSIRSRSLTVLCQG